MLTWLGSLLAVHAATADVPTEQVGLTLADGTPIRGTLYLPEGPGTPVPGVVVLHGSAVGRKSCAPGLSLPLARNGFVTLAIDFRGHGDSGGRLPRSQFENLDQLLGTLAEHPEVDAAVEFLKAHPAVDGRRLALVGHSRGGWAAVNVGFLRPDLSAVVSIGVAPRTADARTPKNLMILAGGRDLLSPRGQGRRAIEAATDGQVHHTEVSFGSLRHGTARRWSVVTRVNHFTQLADDSVTRRAVQWVSEALGIEAGPVPGDDLILVTAAVLLATLSGPIAACWVLRAAAGSAQPVTPQTGNHAPIGLRIVAGVLLLAMIWLAGWITAQIGVDVGPVQFLVPALVLLSCVAVASLSATRLAGSPEWRPCWSAVSRGIGLGLLALGLAVVWLGLPWGTSWCDLIPSPRRLLVAGLVFLVCLLPCLGMASGLGNVLRSARPWLAASGWLIIAALLWTGCELLVVLQQPLFAIPALFLVASFLAPLPLWLMAERPGLSVARGVCQAGALAWLLACHLPFVQTE